MKIIVVASIVIAMILMVANAEPIPGIFANLISRFNRTRKSEELSDAMKLAVYKKMSPQEKILVAGDRPTFIEAKALICINPGKNVLLARYKTVGHLGDGVSASIDKVVDTCDPDKSEWALKTFHYRKVSHDYASGTLKREIRILEKLGQHENIMSYERTISLGKKKSYALMRLMQGCLTRNTFLPMNLAVMRDLMEQVVAGVDHAHSRNVVLVDLKMENILIESTNPVKIRLSDFGFSNDFTISDMGGTPAYMSTEKVLGIQLADHFVDDIWAMGMLMNYLLVDYRVREKVLDSYIKDSLSANPDMKIKPATLILFKNLAPRINSAYGEIPEYLTEFINLKNIEIPFSKQKFYLDIVARAGKIHEHFPDEFKNDVHFMDFFKSCLQFDASKRATAKALTEHPFLQANNQ